MHNQTLSQIIIVLLIIIIIIITFVCIIGHRYFTSVTLCVQTDAGGVKYYSLPKEYIPLLDEVTNHRYICYGNGLHKQKIITSEQKIVTNYPNPDFPDMIINTYSGSKYLVKSKEEHDFVLQFYPPKDSIRDKINKPYDYYVQIHH